MNGIVQFRKCTLTDEELLKKVDQLTDQMYQSGRIPDRQIPARPNDDYDLLVGELVVRFHEKTDHIPDSGKMIEEDLPVNFWKRLELFVAAVQVNDPWSEEEKEMLLTVSREKQESQEEMWDEVLRLTESYNGTLDSYNTLIKRLKKFTITRFKP